MTNQPTYTTELLINQLSSDDLDARFGAASLIGMDRVAGAADALVARLGTETDCQVRERVTWATVQVIDDALPAVLTALTDEQPAVRMQAAHVLSKVGRAEFAPHLESVVADPDAQVAIKGYRAAANTGEATVLPWLAARLGDGDWHQLDALTNAFVTLGEASVPALLAGLSDPDQSVRAHAAEALGHIETADPAVVSALRVAADDASDQVAVPAVSALGQLGEVAEPALRSISQGQNPQLAKIAETFLG